MSGVRFTIANGKATDVQILADPSASPSDLAAFQPLDPAATYRVAATDFQAKIAPGYSDLFKQIAAVTDTGIIVNDLMMATLRTRRPRQRRPRRPHPLTPPDAAPPPASRETGMRACPMVPARIP